ncbi:hypothetical protein ES705_50808 [subsurface metagenome]
MQRLVVRLRIHKLRVVLSDLYLRYGGRVSVSRWKRSSPQNDIRYLISDWQLHIVIRHCRWRDEACCHLEESLRVRIRQLDCLDLQFHVVYVCRKSALVRHL